MLFFIYAIVGMQVSTYFHDDDDVTSLIKGIWQHWSRSANRNQSSQQFSIILQLSNITIQVDIAFE